MSTRIRIAILDDYQNVALSTADWTPVTPHADVTVFDDHLADVDELVERLIPCDVVMVMRERTPLSRNVIERLPRLRMIAAHQLRRRPPVPDLLPRRRRRDRRMAGR